MENAAPSEAFVAGVGDISCDGRVLHKQRAAGGDVNAAPIAAIDDAAGGHGRVVADRAAVDRDVAVFNVNTTADRTRGAPAHDGEVGKGDRGASQDEQDTVDESIAIDDRSGLVRTLYRQALVNIKIARGRKVFTGTRGT